MRRTYHGQSSPAPANLPASELGNRQGVGVMKKSLMQMAICAISISIAAMSATLAQTASSRNPPLLAETDAEWAKDVTVLAIAPDGTWGTATEPFIDKAFAKAIAGCKRKYRRDLGCGYRSTAIRAGWSLAIRCGWENIIVAAKTFEAAEQAAIDSEFSLRRDYQPDMPPCVHVISVDPNGMIIAPDGVQLLRSVVDRTR